MGRYTFDWPSNIDSSTSHCSSWKGIDSIPGEKLSSPYQSWKFLYPHKHQETRHRPTAHGISQETDISSGVSMWFKSGQWDIREQFQRLLCSKSHKEMLSLLPEWLRKPAASFVTGSIFIIFRDPALVRSLQCEWQTKRWKKTKSFLTSLSYWINQSWCLPCFH